MMPDDISVVSGEWSDYAEIANAVDHMEFYRRHNRNNLSICVSEQHRESDYASHAYGNTRVDCRFAHLPI